MGIYMWSEINTGYLPQSFILFLRQGLSLNQELANLAGYDGHQIPRTHQFLPPRAGVYRCVLPTWGDLNLGYRACAASILPSEPSPQSLNGDFFVWFILVSELA